MSDGLVFQSSLKKPFHSFVTVVRPGGTLIWFMSRNSVAVGLSVLKDCCTFASEPLNVTNKLRILVRLLPINPGISAVSIPVTVTLPAPPVATGLKFTELDPVVCAHRSSAPPL